MDMKNLKTFLYVAELSSFTRAAEQLGYAQSTISFQIKQLEAELEAQLFERINRTVVLTDKGRQVKRYAQQIETLAQELQNALSEAEEVSGHIRLAMADSLSIVMMGERFAEFHRRYPHITVKVMTSGTEEMFRLLNHNEADILLTLDSHIYHTEYVIAGERRINVNFVVGADCPLPPCPLKIEQLLNKPFIFTEKGMSYRRLLDELLAERNMEIRPILEMDNTQHICNLVELGVGMAFLPDYVTDDAVMRGAIKRVPVEDVEIEVWEQLLYHRDKWISPAMQAFMDYYAGR